MAEIKATFHPEVESSTEEDLLRQILISLNEMKTLLRLQIQQNLDAQAEWKKWREAISFSDDFGLRVKIKPPPSPGSMRTFI